MTRDLTISVALCTHNGEKFLKDQLLSILNQTTPPREIVLSDDASTDGTVRVASSILADHRRLHPELEVLLLQNPTPLGVAKNFEQAILACTSNLVALCDQDDIWAAEKLKRMAGIFAARPGLMLLHSDARLIDEAGATLPGTLFGALEVSSEALSAIHAGGAFKALLRRNLVTGATAVIRKDLADIAAPFPEAWLHDEWLAMAASVVGELDVVEDTLIAYRQHGTNQIGAVKLSFVNKFGRMIEPGTQRNRRLLARATSLANRFETMRGRVAAPQLAAVRDKLRHEQVRASLPSSRPRRVVPVIRELTTGRYALYGRGVSDAARDLSQPLNTAR
jgi:glycosyltransferase involved in cell wall biosynthesis